MRKSPNWRVDLGVAAAALLMRALALLHALRYDPRAWFLQQASELDFLGESLVGGHGLSSPFGGNTGPSAFLAPGYPLLVAGCFRLFGVESRGTAVALLTLHVLFGTATVWAAMQIARRCFGERGAIVAGLLCAFSPPLLFLPEIFWETTLSTLLLTVLILLAMRCAQRQDTASWGLLGAAAGGALLVNPSLFAVVLATLAYAAWRTRPRDSLVGVAIMLAIFAPWPVRNAIVMRAFIPLRSNFGYELWQGNRPDSDGASDGRLHPNGNREEHARYVTLGELGYMHEKTALALATIMADKPHFAALCRRRAVSFWSGTSRNSSDVLTAYVSTTSLLGCGGVLVLLWRRPRTGVWFLLPLALYPAPYILTHPDVRYRLVLEPLLLVLIAGLATRLRPSPE